MRIQASLCWNQGNSGGSIKVSFGYILKIELLRFAVVKRSVKDESRMEK